MTGTPCHATQTVLWLVACVVALALLMTVALYAGANW